MTSSKISSSDLPGLYQSADLASLDGQSRYFKCVGWYLGTLIVAAAVSCYFQSDIYAVIFTALLFLAGLGILIYLRVTKPDDIWYNGRAVAESVKTRTWRWIMKAEPYQDQSHPEIVRKLFLSDLKSILEQNRSLSHWLPPSSGILVPISSPMRNIRALQLSERLAYYSENRIQDQANWYSKKSIFNKKMAKTWFTVSVVLHSLAIVMLLFKISKTSYNFPIETVATAAGAVLTWLQSKKYNELNSAYSLTAHEIAIIKAEGISISTESELSEFVVNTESAFSREHTQWSARKGD